MRVRIGEVSDAERVSRLLVELSEEFILSEFSAAGRSHLLEEFAAPAMAQRIAGSFRFHLAEDVDALAGVARALWARIHGDFLAGPGAVSRMTVNASNFAVPAYEKLGFRRCGPQVEKMGVIVNPMEFPPGQ